MPGVKDGAWRGAAARTLPLARGPAFGLAAAVGLGFQPGWFKACLAQEVEQRRLFPWIAVCFGIGVLMFFAAEGRPALWAPLAGAGIATTAAFLLRHRPVAFGAAIAGAAMFCGFAAGVLRERTVATAVLTRVVVAPLTAFVEAIEERPRGGRLLLRIVELGTVPPGERPRRVRVTVRDLQNLKPGVFIAGRARLLPLPEPARPGGYDFARDAYFNGFGAVGSIVGKVEVRAPPSPPPLGLTLTAGVDEARNALTRRIADASGGQAGAVAAALITGKRGLISDETNQILRGAGIYHIVSISGLHMVLAAGTFFWLARALLALSTTAALHWPIKKVAAVVAMIGATAYCVFSGSEVATERSLIMILVMLGAILADRRALSLRNLALSALIVLAREPETLLGPSFQMSFGAVAALIAAAEWERGRRRADEPATPLGRAVRWGVRAAIGVLATTVVATIATAPFGSYHFQNLQPFGLIGNALALPLVSVVVMPCAVVGVLAFPFGLDRPVWEVMGFAVAKVLQVSAWVNGLSGSTVIVPAFDAFALGLLGFALVLATLMISPLRWVAVVPAALGIGLATTPRRQDVYLDRAGTGAAIRGADGRLAVLGRASAFTVEQWLRADGDARKATDDTLRRGVRCDPLGCVATLPEGRFVALVQDRRAFPEDCTRATLILTRLRAPPGCQAALVVDGPFLRDHGATIIRRAEAGHEIATARSPNDIRPWMARQQTERPPSNPRAKREPAPRLEPAPSLAVPIPSDDAQDDDGEDFSIGEPN